MINQELDQKELARRNVGENLDWLMNLDPRGYGVCRILYDGARRQTGRPLSMNAAEELCEHVGEGDLVYILTGFVLLPHKKAEMDGVVGSMLLARSLVLALGARPVILCPEDCIKALRRLSHVAGLNFYSSVEEALQYPASVAAIPFTKEEGEALAQAEALLKLGMPAAAIAVECPGANELGVYHNATGLEVTELEAKLDMLFALLQERGVPCLAVGDLGNETGMNAIGEHIRSYIPYAAPGGCSCGCGGGIGAAVGADHIVTATVSDWGCYAVCAALAYLRRDPGVFHTPELQREAMTVASRAGLVDMTGWLVPAIDGIGMEFHLSLVQLMGECVTNPLRLEETCATWFEKTLDRGFFQRVAQ